MSMVCCIYYECASAIPLSYVTHFDSVVVGKLDEWNGDVCEMHLRVGKITLYSTLYSKSGINLVFGHHPGATVIEQDSCP